MCLTFYNVILYRLKKKKQIIELLYSLKVEVSVIAKGGTWCVAGGDDDAR